MQSTKPTSGTWQPDIFNGAGIQREPGNDRADDMHRAGQEMRDTGSSDLFDALPEAPRFRCTGCSSGQQDACSFTTDDTAAALAHFERCDHDVVEAPTVEANAVTFHRPVGGWPTLAELIARHPEAFTFGPQSDDMEYGPVCGFCGNRAAVCRCDR